MPKVTLEQHRSAIGSTKRQKATLECLGFKRRRRVIEKELTPQIKGMIEKVAHLIRVVEEK